MRVDRQPSPSLTAIALLAGACLLAGCRRDAPDLSTFACRCRFLTDHDDLSEQPVTVCANGAAQAGEVAKGCAQSAAPAPVQACECTAVPAAPACRRGACEVAERR